MSPFDKGVAEYIPGSALAMELTEIEGTAVGNFLCSYSGTLQKKILISKKMLNKVLSNVVEVILLLDDSDIKGPEVVSLRYRICSGAAPKTNWGLSVWS